MGTLTKLIAFDTDRIKDYVFATDALKEIRGASALLDNLNRKEMAEIIRRHDPEMQTFYAHGGAGLFAVDAARADEALIAVERAYRDGTGGAASVTGATMGLPPDFDFGKDSVRELVELLQLRLRLSKDRPAEALAVTALPHIRTCDACSQFPATHSVPEYGSTRLVCDACEKRRDTAPGVWERLSEKGVPHGDLPRDFSALGALSKPRGYIGLLYADGNGIGREMEEHATLAELAEFAGSVDEAIHQATCDAVREHLQPAGGTLPFVPLLLGGDDLVLVTRAQSAIDVAITLVERFREHTKQRTGRRLSISVGVVLARANFPFRTALDLAESALKFAKREGARRRLSDRSLINFLTVTSPNHLSYEAFQNETLRSQQPGSAREWNRSLRPYTPEALRHLVEVARDLHDAPRNKLHALAECVFLNHNQSVLEGLTILMRWRGDRQRGRKAEQVKALRDLVDQSGRGECVFPWCAEDNEWRTPLLDLVEVFDFVKRR
jgi:GGDEF domain-containing protein